MTTAPPTRQLTLNLGQPPEQRFETFFAGPNAEALALARGFAEGSVNARSLTLHGPPGAGKTHIINAAAHAMSQRGLRVWSADARSAALQPLPDDADVIIADGEHASLPASLEGELFTWYNAHVATGRARMIVALRPPLAASELRADLRTRLAAGLVVRLMPLDDASLSHALAAHARARGLALNEGVLQYLVTRFSRDMATLTALIEGLDTLSLAEKRAITLPLLRTLIEQKPITV